MNIQAKRIYLKDLEDWEAKGWEPAKNGAGKVKIMGSPTGPQTYVFKREETR